MTTAAAVRTKPKRTVRKPRARATDTVLVLRTCDSTMHSSRGFVWPTKGTVEAPDWKPTKECGNGLHGLLWGEGDGSLLNWEESARWLVVEVLASDILDLAGKVKYPRGQVVFCGDRQGATALIAAHPGAVGKAITAGTATAGYAGTATAGYAGTATAGIRGTATAGYAGTATAGYAGTATAGDAGTATAGIRGTATAGKDGVLVIHHYDAKKGRYVLKVAEVGADGIRANKKYRLNADGRFEVAK